MNNKHIESLTHRLLQALDNNYDVINMDVVRSVIAALESTTITKEQLETTRLAKYINLFRRRTKCEQLAKRAKSLLKKWREMVGIQQPVAGSNASGSIDLQYAKPTSPLASSSGAASNALGSTEKQNKWHSRNEESSEPTSFVNLIPNFSTNFANHNSSAVSPLLNGPSGRNIRKNRNGKVDAINAEQFTNSNSMNVASITPTIVIDIEDSNSGSNVDKQQDDVVIISETTKTSPIIKSSKHKKAKKDKKKSRNDPDIHTTTVVIDAESSESQHPTADITTTTVAVSERPQEKSRNVGLTVTNMSEILSLSNSSMSSIFPTSLVGDTKNYGSAKAHTITDSELSFAGKFGGTGAKPTAKISTCDNSTTNVVGQSSLSGDIYVYNENSNITGSAPVPKTTSKGRIFSVSGYNSNDSVSNSRHSTFEIVGTVVPGVTNPAGSATVNTAKETEAPITLDKIPKKRGRKKGSKGVDSVIAKDTSLSSQMLMQSLSGGNKKVKTTKELYAEMQNRKMGVSTPTTPSHWTSGSSQPLQAQKSQSRRESFCSEPSLHSPRTFDACSTNATISTIATNSTTPDKNPAAIRKSFETSVVDVDSTSDSLISGGGVSRGASVVPESKTKALVAIEQQLVGITLKLPPLQSVAEIEEACASEIVPCTCKVIEILPEPPNIKAEPDSAAMGDLLSLDKLKRSNLAASNEESDIPVLTISIGGNNDQSNNTAMESKEPIVKPKKSIFDLDFDDDDDPLHTLIAEVAAASAVSAPTKISKTDNNTTDESRLETKIQNNQSMAESTPDQIGVGTAHDFNDPSAMVAAIAMPLLPSYKVEEDNFCPAKERFELQTQQITGFHINLLHNFFIPNVNGNWNDALTTGTETEQDTFQVFDGLNVVPKISGDDHIRKDLRDFSFEQKCKPKIIADVSKYETPFLGVARCRTKRHRKTRMPRQKRLKEIDDQPAAKIEDTTSGEIVKDVESNNDKEDTEQIKSECIDDIVELQANEMSSPWSLAINNQKPALEAITVNVDSDDSNDHPTNATSSIDSQNLLAIVSDVVSYSSAEKTEMNPHIDEREEAPLEAVIASDELDFPNISGDILHNNNNNNKSCSKKFESDSSSNSESNSSLKQTQNSINQKLRKHRRRQRRQQELEQSSQKLSPKRKRRRKKQQTPSIKIKCLKIAINGGITTQRHIKIASSNSGSTSEYNSENDSDEMHNEDRESSVDNDKNSSNNEEDAASLDGSDEEISRVDETINDENDMDVACGGEDFDMEDENGEYLDEYDGDDYVSEFHEVVTRDLSPSTSLGNNHIVLTIKKTPSKANSPASNSPNVANQTTALLATASSSITAKHIDEANEAKLEKSTVLVNPTCDTSTQSDGVRHTLDSNLLAAAYAALIKRQSERRRPRRRRRKRKNQESLLYRFPDEVHANEGKRIFKKRHQQLFFPEEIYTQLDADSTTKRCILNISSCSSSCDESTEFEYESNSSDEEKKQTQKHKLPGNTNRCKPELINSSSCSSDSEDSDLETMTLEEPSVTASDKIKDEAINDQVASFGHNNGLLVSFNDICVPKSDQANISDGMLCTETPLSNLNPRTEFHTGVREMDAPSAQEGTPSSNRRLQQFKEWHQVLQLKSFNDEPLTVLPYVVLD